MAGSASILADIAYQIVVAIMYAVVARAVWVRPVHGDARFANISYGMWWGALALVSGFGLVAQVVGWFGFWNVAGLVTYTHVVLLVIFAALAGLQFYFVYLFTGKRGAWIPVAAFYSAFWVATVYLIEWADPIGLMQENGRTTLEYANDLTGTTLAAVFGAMLVLPAWLGAIAYLSLWRKVESREQRFRIATVAGSIILWFSVSLGSTVTGTQETTLVVVLSRVVALTAAALNLIAFRPPGWVRRRFLDEATASPEGG